MRFYLFLIGFILLICSPFLLSGALHSTGASPVNITATMPTGITELNLTCMQPYQDYVEPNGQDTKQPFFVISEVDGDTATNITIKVNETLPSYIQLYGSTTGFRLNYDYLINISENTSIIIKQLSANSTKNVWIWAKCINATDNTTAVLDIEFGAD